MSVPVIDVHEVLRLGAGVDIACAWDSLLGLLEAVEAAQQLKRRPPDAVVIMARAARQSLHLLTMEGEALKAARAQLDRFRASR